MITHLDAADAGSPVDVADLTADPRNAESTALWVERTGTRAYTGRSSRGAEVRIASVGTPGAFSPGELLKIALAACSGLAADFTISRRLGDDVPVTIRVGGPTDESADRYPALAEELVVDLSGLDEAARTRLLTTLARAVDEHCTVGRTLEHGAEVALRVVDAVPASQDGLRAAGGQEQQAEQPAG
ncbi:OsmC family protein [Cellulomonas endophytica]|uniref:OsmC family protein n=1 Tax=Cellulomonas endophytica TaxID=2494735 RepID=UPI0010128759|nr:OsmC family protein [Cellulomonas endophytica]